MERYLSFELSDDDAAKSDFATYNLGNTNLLPNYFGDVAPVNIFLGENNSGKSRFMRAIMKCAPIRMIDYGSISEKINIEIPKCYQALLERNKVDVFDLEIAIQSAGLQNKTLMSFLNLTGQDLHSNTYKIQYDHEVSKLLEIISSFVKEFSEIKSFLNSFKDEFLSNSLSSIKSINVNLMRISLIYKGVMKSYPFGAMNSYIGRDKVQYATQEISISFNTNNSYTSEYFRTAALRDKMLNERISVINYIKEACEPVVAILEKLTKYPRSRTPARTYVPTLRTARTLTDKNWQKVAFVEDVISYTIKSDYDLKDSKVEVNTGLALFSAIDNKRSSDLLDREQFKAFEEFLSETFFNGKLVEVVPNRKTNTILVAVNREERELPHLGDGIQAIILLLYPLFIAHQSAWFFIEEPELNLHPGFQRLFIDTITNHSVIKEKNLTIFITTHSNHILDFALNEYQDVNLFSFRKVVDVMGDTKYQVQLTAPRDLECLTTLGVQNSSVFLSNCTIWVEGITDRIYLKAYLTAYLEHRKRTFSLLEGLHYSFLEYAGANVSHYTFGAKTQQVTITDEALQDIQALSISNRIMLIADQDAGKDTKHQRLTSQQHAGFEYIVIPTREIENLLTPEVIVSALKKLYSKQAEHFDAAQLKQAQYKSIYLAKHLQGKFAELPASFVGSSGTVSSAKKRLFAEAAAEAITSWDMLSPEAQELTKRVFQFIMGHNPRLGSN